MAKSRSGGTFLTDGQHQCLPIMIAGRLLMALRELSIDPWRCSSRLRGGWFCVFLSYLNRFVYGFCLIWNSSPGRV